MDWLDDDGDSAPLAPLPATETDVQMWPMLAVFGLSVAGSVIALWSWLVDLPTLACITYAVLLLTGCGLLWYRRFTAISASRQAGGSVVLKIARVEKVALAFLVIGCVANGIVVAVWIARLVG